VYLFEFNSADWEEKREFLFFDLSVSFKSLRADSEYFYNLYDCGQFYAETKVSKALKKMVDITAFYPDDERINLYIDFYNENKDREDVLD
jgi:hypothetical protein